MVWVFRELVSTPEERIQYSREESVKLRRDSARECTLVGLSWYTFQQDYKSASVARWGAIYPELHSFSLLPNTQSIRFRILKCTRRKSR